MAGLRLFSVTAIVALFLAATTVSADNQPIDGVPYEPIYHLRPEKNWINDPNGPYRDPVNGMIHYYFQYNPFSAIWGNVTWYHVTSTDYVKWQRHWIALDTDKWYDIYGVFSGTMMNNDEGVPTAIYTCVEHHEIDVQRQCVATPSKADLEGPRKFDILDKSPLNVVIDYHDVPGLYNSGQFRDPTEWWPDPAHPGQWLIAFVARIVDATGDNAHVVLFKTTDPTFQSGYEFSHTLWQYDHDPDHMFECPDWFTLHNPNITNGTYEHFLKVSTMPSHRDYFVYGTYAPGPDGDYIFTDDKTRSFTFMDYGPYYAAKSFWDPIQEKRFIWGWTNEELTDAQRIAQGWSGIQNILRGMEYDATEKKLKTFPIPETKGLRNLKLVQQEGLTVGATPTVVVPAGTTATRYHEILASFEVSDPSVFSATATYTDATAPEIGVMIRANTGLTSYTTVSVRMPAGGPTATAAVAEDEHWPIWRMYTGPSVENCSSQCKAERVCESWTYASGDQSCKLYWLTNNYTASSGATSGTVREPLLYFGRALSGTIGEARPLSGRAPFRQTAPNRFELQIFVDDSVIEIFKDGGLETLTGRLYIPDGVNQTGIALYARNMGSATVTANVTVFTVDSIWETPKPTALKNFTDSMYGFLASLLNE
ncbi:Glycosyl hydrolases family 32 N-terminal domain/Glycosyl hydrolases family 32 C terminal, putative [Angomonas deanei]|uniref:Glycosyl hydrolases family 32 N-terminal domain/Glycosyl hydrolases family 32 C terminal, putative n=1 Tax=Angomonas deanei TaxID=59799 RepID=A0A7G2CNR0_9TRYP|nr:Glycosyl hydrolases family 32 N-terminal domain/Glycosyl hydrolases family 32 C terminal, putative [Angomonas deanei]